MDTPNPDGDAAGVGRVRCEFGIYSGDSSLIHALTTVRLANAGRTATSSI
jgi:hypothetical protein